MNYAGVEVTRRKHPNSKPQAPSSREIPTSKYQSTPMQVLDWSLVIEVSGAWMLVLGAFHSETPLVVSYNFMASSNYAVALA
jgi:hypothetical protein